MSEFDPRRHRVVAIVVDGAPEEIGQHLHVSLADLARDAQSELYRVDLDPLEQRVLELERRPPPVPQEAAGLPEIVAALVEAFPAVDLGPVFARLDALERRQHDEPVLPALDANLRAATGGPIETDGKHAPGDWRQATRAIDDDAAWEFQDDEPQSFEERRGAASGQIKDAAKRAIALPMSDQVRYEVAVQARNGSARALAMLVPEAHDRGISAAGLAVIIIDARQEYERLVMTVTALEQRGLLEIEQATEASLEEATAAAIQAIMDVGATHGPDYRRRV